MNWLNKGLQTIQNLDQVQNPRMNTLMNHNAKAVLESYIEALFLYLAYTNTPITQTKDMNLLKGFKCYMETLTTAIEDPNNNAEDVHVFKKYLFIDQFGAFYRDLPPTSEDNILPYRSERDKRANWYTWITTIFASVDIHSSVSVRTEGASILDMVNYRQRMEFLNCFIKVIFEIEKFNTFGFNFYDYDDQENMDSYVEICQNIITMSDSIQRITNSFVYQSTQLKHYFSLTPIHEIAFLLKQQFADKNE